MTSDNASDFRRHISVLAQDLARQIQKGEIREALPHLERLLRDALGTNRFRDDLAELYGKKGPEEIALSLSQLGLRTTAPQRNTGSGPADDWVCSPSGIRNERGITIEAFGPRFDETISVSRDNLYQLDAEWESHCRRVKEPDPFLSFYRTGVADYVRTYRSRQAPRIHEFIKTHFGSNGPRYLITVGIGANEQFWHFAQRCYALHRGEINWIIADNPKDIAKLPPDARIENSLVLEFSRSGKTQEVVKFDEFLDPAVKRIVFANSGPLAQLAERHPACLKLEMEEAIPGRFSKNLSPIMIAPLDILGLPIDDYWNRITSCIESWDLTDLSSPPVVFARYLRAAQITNGANHVYLGCNDEILLASCDEFVQFWNEGVNKGNDFSMSRYFGLPRDSHLNIEGILANHGTKAAVFVLRRGGDSGFNHLFRAPSIQPINRKHVGLSIADVDYVLARANVVHFGTMMPTITIEIDEPDLLCSATLSQLWADTVFVYSTMIGVNPGSNPQVRHVRDRADQLLTDFTRASN